MTFLITILKKTVLAVIMVCMAWSLALAAAHNISSREAKTLMEKKKNIFLLDVRTPQENSQTRLPGSVLIPIGEFERRISEVPKNKTIVVYCAVGSRSKPVAEYLSKNGYKNVYNMTDGIVGWYRNGFPLQR
ncbi:MAG: rhodanese-like domain-containing protein [Verrucomicrobia bacterium]|nr:rhodanese-like domain-containing protein [Deltaproteobacteria bacterium]